MAASSHFENAVRTIFKRCVDCPNEVPVCPACNADEVCSQMAASCAQCASTACVKISSSGVTNTGATSTSSKGHSVGAIAGGVIGGVAFIAILTYLVWRFVIKPRRQKEEEDWEEEFAGNEKAMAASVRQRSDRASTHTVASIASTVLTRASNIIQIAYIPGVTNRSEAGMPSELIPPVPPIPAGTLAETQPATQNVSSDTHFFMPGDLRDSTYSGNSENTEGRNSIVRQSITPSLARSLARSSLTPTIYRDDAMANPLPAQTIIRGRAAVVSVKSSQNTSPVETPDRSTPTPPVVPVDNQSYSERSGTLQEPIATVSDGPTLRMTPSPFTAVRARPGRVIEARPLTEASMASSSSDTGLSSHSRARRLTSSFDDSSDEEETETEASRRQTRHSLVDYHDMQRMSEVTEIQDTPGQSPFSDIHKRNSTGSSISGGGGSLRKSPSAARRLQQQRTLGSVIEEATRRASQSELLGGIHDLLFFEGRHSGPFSDQNAL